MMFMPCWINAKRMIDYRENAIYKVYIHISPVNKYYVGITKQNPIENRWRKNGNGYIKCKYFWHAIQKYGWDNFKHEIIAENLTIDEASNMEKILIYKLKSTDKKYGYNILKGGIETVPPPPNEFPNRWVSVKQYDLNGNYIKTFKSMKDAARSVNGNSSSISAVCRKLIQSAYGYMWSYKDDVVDSPRTGWHEYPITQYDLNCSFIRKYKNLQDVYEKTGYGKSGISECCNHNRDSSMGFIWRYNDELPTIPIKPRTKKIKCFDKNKKYIKTYESLSSTGLNSSNIRTAILNNKMAYGYYWEYEDGLEN